MYPLTHSSPTYDWVTAHIAQTSTVHCHFTADGVNNLSFIFRIVTQAWSSPHLLLAIKSQ